MKPGTRYISVVNTFWLANYRHEQIKAALSSLAEVTDEWELRLGASALDVKSDDNRVTN